MERAIDAKAKTDCQLLSLAKKVTCVNPKAIDQ